MERNETLPNFLLTFEQICSAATHEVVRLPRTGAAQRAANELVDALHRRIGAHVAEERVVGLAIYLARIYTESRRKSLHTLFSVRNLERFMERAYAQRHFEDRWLEGIGLHRHDLTQRITAQPGEERFVYLHAEEGTKRRLLGTRAGFLLCQFSTRGWSPLSGACAECCWVGECRTNTQRRFPELYQIRLKHEQ